MKSKIIASIIATNQKELNERLKKAAPVKNFQLDIMDGKFVKNKSLLFDFKLPKVKEKRYYEAHLMIKNPEKWIKKHYKKVSTIIFHLETVKDIDKTIKLIKSMKRNVGIAINPKTPINKLIPYLNKINLVLIMTVNPGKYGAKFLPIMLKKIKALHNIKPSLNIEVDGGISDETVGRVSKAGANIFASGFYLDRVLIYLWEF